MFLRINLVMLGLSAIGIGVSMFLLGSQMTVQFFVSLLEFLIPQQNSIDDLSAANVDSELRFYSVFWIAYGALLIQSAKPHLIITNRVSLLLAMFTLAGIGRLLSYWLVGPPHTLFVVLMIIELVLPMIMLPLWLSVRNK